MSEKLHWHHNIKLILFVFASVTFSLFVSPSLSDPKWHRGVNLNEKQKVTTNTDFLGTFFWQIPSRARSLPERARDLRLTDRKLESRKHLCNFLCYCLCHRLCHRLCLCHCLRARDLRLTDRKLESWRHITVAASLLRKECITALFCNFTANAKITLNQRKNSERFWKVIFSLDFWRVYNIHCILSDTNFIFCR